MYSIPEYYYEHTYGRYQGYKRREVQSQYNYEDTGSKAGWLCIVNHSKRRWEVMRLRPGVTWYFTNSMMKKQPDGTYQRVSTPTRIVIEDYRGAGEQRLEIENPENITLEKIKEIRKAFAYELKYPTQKSLQGLKLIDIAIEDYDYSTGVTFYFGRKEDNDYTGDDWNDSVYDSTGDPVYSRYVVRTFSLVPSEKISIVPPSSLLGNSSMYNKNMMKRNFIPGAFIVNNMQPMDMEYKNVIPIMYNMPAQKLIDILKEVM